jgi:hypothetical protein
MAGAWVVLGVDSEILGIPGKQDAVSRTNLQVLFGIKVEIKVATQPLVEDRTRGLNA